MNASHLHVADGLATAMLAGRWTRASVLNRCRPALGVRTSPPWLLQLVDQTLELYREPPLDRPRELSAVLCRLPAWDAAWKSRRRPPRITRWTPVPTRVVDDRWPVALLPDHDALARLLDLDQGELDWFADVRSWERRVGEPLRHYRWTAAPRPHGVRLLAAPKPRLMEIQRRLLRHVLEPIPVHDAAHGCVRGRSVRSAVAPHAGSTVVIRLDLEAFYPSVPAGRVWEVLRRAGLPEGVAHTVTGLLTTVAPAPVRALVDPSLRPRLARPHLPQGAPSSPAVANLVAFSLDRRLAGLARRFDARYTRYVDDLSFSGGPSLRNARSRFVAAVEQIVRDEGFAPNDRKTVVLGDAGRQALLGTVVNVHPSVPRSERDALRALLHNCAKYGWRTQTRGRADFRNHVLGRIAWVGSLDADHGARLREAFDAVDWHDDASAD